MQQTDDTFLALKGAISNANRKIFAKVDGKLTIKVDVREYAIGACLNQITG